MLKVLNTLLVFALIAVASEARANREELISAPTGGQPYKIVLKSEAKDTGLEPGLYSRNGADWAPLLTGEVLLDPKRGPLVQVLNLSKFDDRVPLVTVINGRVILANVLSDAKVDGSMFVLGHEPVEEIGTGTKRALPLIQSTEHVVIVQTDETLFKKQDGQLVLVSLRGPEEMTIAVRLKRSEGAKVELLGPPLILDHKFRKADELQKMFRKDANKDLLVYSDLLQQLFLSRLKITDHGEYQPLVDALITTQSECQKANANFCNVNKLAHWNAETGRAKHVDNIVVREVIGNFDMHMNWPILSGVPTIQIGMRDSSNVVGTTANPLLRGRFRLNKEGHIWNAFNHNAAVNSPAVVAIENELYMVVTNNSSPIKMVKLGPVPASGLPTRMSIAALRKDGSDKKSTLYVVVSQSNSDTDEANGVTRLYVIPLNQPGDILPVARSFDMANFFYRSQELAARLIQDSESRLIVFDNATPPQGDAGKYAQEREPSTPFLNLETSVSGSPKYIYTQPTKDLFLAGTLRYKEFKVKAHMENPSGIFNPDGNPHEAYPGILLSRSTKERGDLEESDFDLLRMANAIRSQKSGEVSAKIYALDPSFRNGEKGIDLVLQMSANKDGKTTNVSSVIGRYNHPFKDIVDVRFISGRREHSDQFYVTVFLANGTIFVTPVTIKGERLLASQSVQFAIRNELSSDEFMQRLVHDQQKGDLYFIQTPGIPPTSRDFAVTKISTMQTLYPKREFGDGSLTFDFDNNVAAQFQTISDESKLSWKVKPFRPDEAERTESSAADLARSELFAQFRKLLEEAADPTQPHRRRVILVPKEIKALAMEFVKESYLVKTRQLAPAGARFHRYNRDLGLYIFDLNRAHADGFFENFEIIDARPTERAVIVADLNHLEHAGRPTSPGSSKPFVLQIPQVSTADDDRSDALVQHETVTPHALYLMAAGGPVPFEDFRSKLPEPRATTLLVGTEAELQQIQDEAEPEMAAGLDKAFEIVQLPPLTVESKTALLREIMARPDIMGLKFEFDASQIVDGAMTPEQQQQKIFEYAAIRIDAISQSRQGNSFSAFIDFVKLYNEKILTDPVVRTSRKIDRSFIERILKVQFNLALNLADLPPDDPRVLLSGDEAVFRLQRAGMLGEFALKAEIIRLTLAQLNHDPARVMPSTWIWAGEPGTGKTKAWDALAKMLKLKMYRRGDKNKNDANGFYLDTVRVKKGDAAAIDQVIDDLNEFVSSPKGQTGFIFFDDLSFADDALGKAIVQWVRGLQQAERGVYRVTKKDGSTHTVSVQNLAIGIAMNFTDNKATLAQYKGDDVSDLVGKIVATGSRFGMDKSFVDRFGGVYNFDKFHESVKEPSLNQALLEAAQKKMARTGQFVVVDPELVRMAAKAFPNLGARPFLSKTTDAIISEPDQLQLAKTKIFAVIPKSAAEVAEAESIGSGPQKQTGAWGQESGDVKAWVQKHARVVELEHGLGARMMLMRLMIPSFRSPILESLVYALQMDPRFKTDRLSGSFFQVPSLLASYDHLMRSETIPLEAFHFEDAKKEEWDALIPELSVGQSPFVIPFPSAGGRLSIWPELGIGGQRVAHMTSRKDILLKYSPKIQTVIKKHLLNIMNVQDLSQLKDVDGWLRSLPDKVPFRSDELGRELSDLLFQFMREFESPDLLEAQSRSGSEDLNPYVSTRFFLMAIDQAITQLPWSDLSHKMVKALQLISQDMALGQSIGVQNWLFNPEDRSSLVKPSTANLLREMVEFNPLVRELPEGQRSGRRTQFEAKCESYLTGARN